MRKNKKSFWFFFERKKTRKEIGREWNIDMVNDIDKKETLEKVKVAIIDSGIDGFATNIEVIEKFSITKR